jgi:hypothetical protein
MDPITIGVLAVLGLVYMGSRKPTVPEPTPPVDPSVKSTSMDSTQQKAIGVLSAVPIVGAGIATVVESVEGIFSSPKLGDAAVYDIVNPYVSAGKADDLIATWKTLPPPPPLVSAKTLAVFPNQQAYYEWQALKRAGAESGHDVSRLESFNGIIRSFKERIEAQLAPPPDIVTPLGTKTFDPVRVRTL